MTDRRGGIPAWQRADYKPPTDKDHAKETSGDHTNDKENEKLDEVSSKDASESNYVETSKPALDAARVNEQGQVRSTTQNTASSGASNSSLSSPLLSPQQQRQQSPPSDRPPIITYPEHLAQPQKPPPLVTTTRLLNTAYVFAGVAATCYGISNYLVRPMTESLRAARHDFHSHSQSKIEELNKRLEGIVSVDPVQGVLKGRQHHSRDASAAIDTASMDSDPTELFHRDIGTQTAPEDLPKRSNSDSSEENQVDNSPAEAHRRQLERIRNAATTLSSDSLSSESQTLHEVRTMTDMLREQLEGLAYPISSDGGSFGHSGNGAGFHNLYGASGKKDTDEVSKVKQEIRSLKGSLLSARSFPTGGVSAGRKELFPAR